MKQLKHFDKFYVVWNYSDKLEPFYVTSVTNYRSKVNIVARPWETTDDSMLIAVVRTHLLSAEIMQFGIMTGTIFRHRWQYRLCRFLHKIRIIK